MFLRHDSLYICVFMFFDRDVKNVIKQIKNVKNVFYSEKIKNVIKNVLLIAGYR